MVAAAKSGLSNVPSADTSSEHDYLKTRITPVTEGDGAKTKRVQPIGAQIGRVLGGRYQLDSCIGSGGMGEIYRARRLHIGDTVAVKVLRPDVIENEKTRQRFYREARAAAMLHHPNAVVIHDFGEDTDGTAYIVMELLIGRSLRQLLVEEGRVEPVRAYGILRQAAAALDAGHRNGIVHRDIKPDNIYLLDSNDEADHIKILDFGIAKLNDKALDTLSLEQRLTNVGTIIGTPHYMSPEQCQGEEADSRSDIYSLGVVLYEMLTGVVPFVAKTPTGVAIKHVTEKPRSPREINPAISPAVESIVLHAMEKEPSARPQTALELAREFDTSLRRESKYESSTEVFGAGDRESAPGSKAVDDQATGILPQPPETVDAGGRPKPEAPMAPPQSYDTFIVGLPETSSISQSVTENISSSATDLLPSALTAKQRPAAAESKAESAKSTEVIPPPAKTAKPAPPVTSAKPEAVPTGRATDALRTDPFGQTQRLDESAEKVEVKSAPGPQAAKTERAPAVRPLPAAAKPAQAKSRTPLFAGVGVLLLLLAGLGAWLLGSGKEKSDTTGAKTDASPVSTGAPASSSTDSQISPPPGVTPPEGMMYVLGGVLRIGRDDSKEENERPAHVVTIRPFFMDRTEVTNEQYQKFVAAGHAAPPSWNGETLPQGGEKLPVTDVSWNDAVAYAEWAGKRLPTEEEWEFAARGLNDKNLYPWGEDWLDDAANVMKDKNDKRQLMSVGQFLNGASPFGVLDLIGNAWEWTASDYKEYPGGKVEALAGFSNLKVLRGGSYQSLAGKITATARFGWPAGRDDWPKNRKPDYSQTGFRCAKDAKGQ
jgi:serine/threonine protein kinase